MKKKHFEKSVVFSVQKFVQADPPYKPQISNLKISNLKPPHLNSQTQALQSSKILNLKPQIFNPELSDLKSQNLKSLGWAA